MSLNECFHLCKVEAFHPVKCIKRCFNVYEPIFESVKVKLNKEYDELLNI